MATLYSWAGIHYFKGYLKPSGIQSRELTLWKEFRHTSIWNHVILLQIASTLPSSSLILASLCSGTDFCYKWWKHDFNISNSKIETMSDNFKCITWDMNFDKKKYYKVKIITNLITNLLVPQNFNAIYRKTFYAGWP